MSCAPWLRRSFWIVMLCANIAPSLAVGNSVHGKAGHCPGTSLHLLHRQASTEVQTWRSCRPGAPGSPGNGRALERLYFGSPPRASSGSFWVRCQGSWTRAKKSRLRPLKPEKSASEVRWNPPRFAGADQSLVGEMDYCLMFTGLRKGITWLPWNISVRRPLGSPGSWFLGSALGG